MRTIELGFVALATLTLAACAAPTDPDAERSASTEEAFKLLPQNDRALINRVRDASINVCITGPHVTDENRDDYGADTRDAILDWIAPLLAISSAPLLRDSGINFSCTSPNVTVNVADKPLRAQGTYGEMWIGSDDHYDTILHEMGHVFGLADTYIEGVFTCQDGQPDSEMCNLGAIREDDMNGIRQLYCDTFTAECPLDFASKFRGVAGWAFQAAQRATYAGGFPNFNTAIYPRGQVFGTILFKRNGTDWQDVAAAEMQPSATNDDLIRSANRWAFQHGYVGGLPTFHRGVNGVYGVNLVKREAADFIDIPVSQLGRPRDTEARFRAVDAWAASHGYVSGFPTMNEAVVGGVRVYGAVLLKAGYADWRDASRGDLAIK